jgi:hypothetical protein
MMIDLTGSEKTALTVFGARHSPRSSPAIAANSDLEAIVAKLGPPRTVTEPTAG